MRGDGNPYIIIVSLENLHNIVACIKQLLGYLWLNPTGITPDLQTFTAEQFRAESRVEFNQYANTFNRKTRWDPGKQNR